VTRGPIPPLLLPDSARLEQHETYVGGVALSRLADQFGTPLFVYDEDTLRNRCRQAARAFDDGVAFASKSFLCAAMARLAVEEGLCIDVATGGELDLVLRAGIPANRIVMHGNNKSDEELRRALEVGVRHIVLDNFDEIERLSRVVSGNDEVACLVRVTPGVEAHTHEFVQTGHEDTKFGLSIASGDARRALDLVKATPGLRLDGVHAHIGSQIFDLDGFRTALGIVWHFVANDGIRELCIGGGLGVAYVEGEAALSIETWGAELRSYAETVGIPSSVFVTAEPGRAIVASAAVTLYTVGAVKPVAARTYMAVDGGMSDNPRPVLYGSGYEVFDVRQPLADRPQSVRLVGKHCESGDILVDEAWVPASTGVGDIVATPVTGAYGYSMASNYNRVPRPAVVFVKDGEVRLVVRRETFDDLARLDATL
jgi:diaminopimelate decarboxylase